MKTKLQFSRACLLAVMIAAGWILSSVVAFAEITSVSDACNSAVHIRLPKPVDWVTGQVPQALQELRNTDLHRRFFSRNKFNQLTTENLTSIEKDIRAELNSEKPLQLNDRSMLQFELATVMAQNHPTFETAKEAKQWIQKSRENDWIDAVSQNSAKQVEEFIDQMLSEGNEIKPLKQVNWAISNQCPYCCVGCYFNFRNAQMTLDQARLVAKKLKEAGVEEIILTGGDPILSPDFLNYIDLLHDSGFKIAVDSTGYTLTAEMAAHLKGKLVYFGIPVDGVNEETVSAFRKGQKDIFEKTQKTVQLLKEYEIPIKINTTVIQKNVDQLDQIADWVEKQDLTKQWGWSIFQWWDTRAEERLFAQHAVPDATFLKRSTELLEKYPGIAIRVGSIENRSRMYFEIMTNGDVLNYSDGAVPGSVIMGNLINESVERIVASPALDKKNSGKFTAWFTRSK